MNSNTSPPAEAPVITPTGNVAGKAVVMGVLIVAVSAASFALWWNMARSRRALAFWGSANVRLIQQSKQVELLVLMPKTDEKESGDFLQVGERAWRIADRVDVSAARGLVHARHALTDDASYEAEPVKSADSPQWTHAVRFGDKNGAATVLMDFPRRRFGNFETGQEIAVIEKIASGWQTFVGRHDAPRSADPANPAEQAKNRE